MKKIIVITLIISIMNLLGCYYQEHLTTSSYNFDDHSKIHVVTQDTAYNLGGNDYYFENDTLFVTLSKKIDRQTVLKTQTQIPEDEIKEISIERTDVGMTLLLTAGILVSTLGLIFMLNFDDIGPFQIKGPGESGGNSL